MAGRWTRGRWPKGCARQGCRSFGAYPPGAVGGTAIFRRAYEFGRWRVGGAGKFQVAIRCGTEKAVFAGTGNGYDDDELYSLYFTYEGIQDHTIDLYWIYFNGHNGGSMGTLGNRPTPTQQQRQLLILVLALSSAILVLAVILMIALL